ncbi:MAG: (d)CMP kinase [Burkholderiales bacterium]
MARKLGFHYLNSGALYRAVAYAAIDAGADLENESRIAGIAMNLKAKFSGEHVVLNGQDVTDLLLGEKVTDTASRVAALPKVRVALMERQRAFRQPPGLVADGRDMGSVVFPDAVLKIFLTATSEERAARRYKQLMEKGMGATMAALLKEIRERDQRDIQRATAPLKKSADAVLIDTTKQSAAKAIAQVLALYKQASKAP